MCDSVCVHCATHMEQAGLAALVIGQTPDRAAIMLCDQCGRPNQLTMQDTHLRIEQLDPDIYQALLHDPHYQKAQFNRLAGRQ